MKKVYFLFLSLIMFSSFFSLNDLDYVKNLISENDYYRATSELKKNLFFEQDSLKQAKITLVLAYTSFFSNRSDQAAFYLNKYEHLIKKPYDNPDYRHLKLTHLCNENNHIQTLNYFADNTAEKDTLDFLILSYAQFSLNYLPESIQTLNSSGFSSNPDLTDSEKIISSYLNSPKKNPKLAAFLSTVIPGSGQLYSQHTYDALQSFLYVSAFTTASVLALNYDNQHKKNFPVATIAIPFNALFYSANIYGAYKTAEYRNLNITLSAKTKLYNILQSALKDRYYHILNKL